MTPELFAKLAEAPVPPAPADLDRGVHRRINERLTVGQMVDIATSGFAFVALHLAKGLAELVRVTVTGEFEPRSPGEPRQAP